VNKIRERHYVWSAVGHEGELLESYVTKKRDEKAMRCYGPTNEIVTDELRSFGSVVKEPGYQEK
jgi:putative transposase